MQQEIFPIHTVHAILYQTLGPSRYDMWIKPSKIQISNIWINIFTPSVFAYEQISSLQGTMEFALRQILPQYFFRIFPPSAESSLTSLVVLDKFIAGPENKFLSSLLKNLSHQTKWGYGPLFIWGEDGMGKSHFLKTLEQARKNIFPKEKILSMTGKDLWDYFNSPSQAQRRERLRLSSFDLLLIDDFYLEENSAGQKNFLKALNKWFEKPRPLVITGSHPINSYPFSLNPLYSRLAHGMIIRIDPPSIETRLAIAYGCFSRTSEFAPEVVRLVVENIKSPGKMLEGLEKLSREGGEKLTAREVGDLLLDWLGARRLSPKALVSEVARYFEVSPEDISSRKQRRHLTRAKKIAAYLLFSLLELSYEEIQPYLGNLSIPTLRLYCREFKKTKDGSLLAAFEALSQSLQTTLAR